MRALWKFLIALVAWIRLADRRLAVGQRQGRGVAGDGVDVDLGLVSRIS
jgi:hypothetical protein